MGNPRDVLLLLALTVACRPQVADPPRVEVITDGAQIEAARTAAADRRAARLAELLEHPDWIVTYDPEGLEILRSELSHATAHLQAIRDDPGAPSERRLHALIALRHLGAPAPIDEMVTLADGGRKAALAFLFAIDDLFPDHAPLPAEVRLRIAAWVASPDGRVQAAAVRIAGHREVEEAGEALERQALTSAKPDRGVLEAAAQLRPSAELLTVLERRLESTDALVGSPELAAVTALGEATMDPALRHRAARVGAAFLAHSADRPWIDGGTMSCIEMIASIQPPQDAEAILTELVSRARWKAMSTSALRALEKLDRAVAADLAATEGLSLSSDGATQAEMSVPSATECARILVELGVLTRADADAALANRAQDLDPDDSLTMGAEGLLDAAGRLVVFDVETGMVPNRHDLLLADFAAASAGRFRPEAALEDYAEEGDEGFGTYTVQFIHGGRLYRFHPEDLGDWYDVTAVVTAIHLALADAGVSERFVQIEFDGQVVVLAFADPAALAAASARLGLALSHDLDAPRKAGKAFEERVVGHLDD